MRTIFIFSSILSAYSVSAQILGNDKYSKEFILIGTINTSKGDVMLTPFHPLATEQEQNKAVYLKSSVNKGQFKVQGKVPYPYYFKLDYLDNGTCKYESEYFVIEPGLQKAIFNTESNFPNVKNNIMKEFYESESFKKYRRLKKDYHWLNMYTDSLNQLHKKTLPDSIKTFLKAVNTSYKDRENYLIESMITELPNSYVSLWNFFYEYCQTGFNDDYDFVFPQLSTTIKHSKFGLLVKTKMDRDNIIGNGKKMPTQLYKNIKSNAKSYLKFGNKYTLLQYWFTGCGKCIKEIPSMKNMKKNYEKNGFDIISVSFDKTDRISLLNKIVGKYQPNWSEYVDENGKELEQLGITYPRYILLDSNGIIIDNRSSVEKVNLFLKTQFK